MIRWTVLLVLLLAGPAHAVQATRGYVSRACGLDANKDGTIGDCGNICNRVSGAISFDDDGDGTNENEYYVACGSGSDVITCGAPGSPCRTINYALNTRAASTPSVQNVVCFRGTCNAEPESVRMGPNGPAGFYTRTQNTAQNEQRAFQYPSNPTMLVGWDFNQNGDYPPHDTGDTAVIDGTDTKEQLFSDQRPADARDPDVPRRLEMAHFAIKNYANAPTCEDHSAQECGVFRSGWQGTGDADSIHVYLHDIELTNIASQAWSPGGLSIVFDYFHTRGHYQAIENFSCLDCGGFVIRGSPNDGGTSGPFRFKNMTYRGIGNHRTPPHAGASAKLFKMWSQVDGIELLNSTLDQQIGTGVWVPDTCANCCPASNPCYAHTEGVQLAQCVQDVAIVNNRFLNVREPIYMEQDSSCVARPIDNIRINENDFLATSNAWGDESPFPDIAGDGGSTAVYVRNVTVLNNTFYKGNATSVTPESALGINFNRSGAANDGTLTVVNNTFYGNYPGSGNYAGGVVGLKPGSNPIQHFVFRNNVWAGITSSGIHPFTVNYAPTDFRADNNVYDPTGTFIWNAGAATSFAGWQSSLGGCAGTDNDCASIASCEPTFVGVPDLHLQPSDTCAVNKGSTQTALTTIDIDAQTRPFQSIWDAGADEVDTGATLTTTTATSTTITTSTSGTVGPTTTTSSTLPPTHVTCGNVYAGGGFTPFWGSNQSCALCMTGADGIGYTMNQILVRPGTLGTPATFKVALYDSNGAADITSKPVGPLLCEAAPATLTTGVNNVFTPTSCPALAQLHRYYLCFIAGSDVTELGDLATQGDLGTPPSCAGTQDGTSGRYSASAASIADPFPNANTLTWATDACRTTVWADLLVTGGTTTTTVTTTTAPGATTTTIAGHHGGGTHGGGVLSGCGRPRVRPG